MILASDEYFVCFSFVLYSTYEVILSFSSSFMFLRLLRNIRACGFESYSFEERLISICGQQRALNSNFSSRYSLSDSPPVSIITPTLSPSLDQNYVLNYPGRAYCPREQFVVPFLHFILSHNDADNLPNLSIKLHSIHVGIWLVRMLPSRSVLNHSSSPLKKYETNLTSTFHC